MPYAYFRLWALFLPPTSFLVLPQIQGTTPAYLFALLLIIPLANYLILPQKIALQFFRDLFLLTAIFICLNLIAQLALLFFNPPSFGVLPFIDPFDPRLILRKSMFTQSLYLLAAVSTFLFVRHCYVRDWDKWIFAGVIIFAIYGVYEVVYYLATGQFGDFISNRTFGSGEKLGSKNQLIALGPVVTLRLKSLTGEASMYAYIVLPFWIYAIHTKRTFIHIFLMLTLLLSTSTTAYIGMALYFLLRFLRYGIKDESIKYMVIGGSIFAILAAINADIFLEAYRKIFVEKLAAENTSGFQRLTHFLEAFRIMAEQNTVNQLFGVGFGYVRATNMFSTLLVNMGIIGVLLATVIFMRPVCKLPNDYRSFGIKAALIVIFVTMMISVPEFSFLSTWLFLGIAYREMNTPAPQTDTHEPTVPQEVPGS